MGENSADDVETRNVVYLVGVNFAIFQDSTLEGCNQLTLEVSFGSAPGVGRSPPAFSEPPEAIQPAHYSKPGANNQSATK